MGLTKTRHLLHLFYPHEIVARYTSPEIFAHVTTIALGSMGAEEEMGRLLGSLLSDIHVMNFVKQDSWAQKALAFYQLDLASIEPILPHPVRKILNQVQDMETKRFSVLFTSILSSAMQSSVLKHKENKRLHRIS